MIGIDRSICSPIGVSMVNGIVHESQEIEDSKDQEVDLASPIAYLLSLYKVHLESQMDSRHVVSGGIQQLINKNQYNEHHVTVEQPKRIDGTCTHILNLPVDVQLHILSHLEASDLCRVASVCKYWSEISCDNLLWRQRLTWDVKKWMQISHTTNPVLYQEVNSDWTDKEIYLKCSPEINKYMHQQNLSFQHLSRIFYSFFSRKTPFVAMFGPGLESETSGLARKMMFQKNKNFVTTGMFPGTVRGYGAGISLRLQNSVNFNLTTLYTSNKRERENIPQGKRLQHNKLLAHRDSDDDESTYEIKPAIKSLCLTVDAFVFVINASKENILLHQDKQELFAMVNERWSSPYVPVVVLSCIKDSTVQRMPCIDVVRQLEMNKLSRPWQVYNCDIDTLGNIAEAFEWVINQSYRR